MVSAKALHISLLLRILSLKGKHSSRYLLDYKTNWQDPWLTFLFRFQGLTSRQKAESWDSFHECIHRRTGEPHVICKYCGGTKTHPWRLKSKPTTPLKDHLSNCHLYKQFQRTNSQSSSVTQYFPSNQSSHERQPLTRANIEDQVLKFFISANIPFRQVENEFFRELVSWININGRSAQAPSRKVTRARLTGHALSSKADLKMILISNKSKVSLALDCWTSRTNFSFLGTSQFLCYIKPCLLIKICFYVIFCE